MMELRADRDGGALQGLKKQQRNSLLVEYNFHYYYGFFFFDSVGTKSPCKQQGAWGCKLTSEPRWSGRRRGPSLQATHHPLIPTLAPALRASEAQKGLGQLLVLCTSEVPGGNIKVFRHAVRAEDTPGDPQVCSPGRQKGGRTAAHWFVPACLALWFAPSCQCAR